MSLLSNVPDERVKWVIEEALRARAPELVAGFLGMLLFDNDDITEYYSRNGDVSDEMVRSSMAKLDAVLGYSFEEAARNCYLR